MGEMAEQMIDDAITYGTGFYGHSYEDVFEFPEPTVKEEAIATIERQPYFHGIEKAINF
jgi:hypothetical protein